MASARLLNYAVTNANCEQIVMFSLLVFVVKGKAFQLQALRGREGSRRLRHPDFKTIGI
jgi:hypothetical protein